MRIFLGLSPALEEKVQLSTSNACHWLEVRANVQLTFACLDKAHSGLEAKMSDSPSKCSTYCALFKKQCWENES